MRVDLLIIGGPLRTHALGGILIRNIDIDGEEECAFLPDLHMYDIVPVIILLIVRIVRGFLTELQLVGLQKLVHILDRT